MAKGVTEIYNEVLSILPYSVTGHIELDKKLHQFYEKLVETNYIKYNPKFTFLSSAILSLSTDNNRQNNSHKQLNDWELGSFDELFYKTFVEGDKEEALSFYFYLLEWAALKMGIDKFSTSELLSKFFISDLDFRVGLILDNKVNRPNVKFDKRRKLFEINIPISLFKNDEYENLIHLRLNLNKVWFGKEKYIKKVFRSGRLYKVNNPSNTQHFKEVFQMLFDEDKVDRVVEIISVEYLKEFAKFNLYNKDEDFFKQIAYCSICISFLCLYYECYVEYMLSVAKVEYRHSMRDGQTVFQAEHKNIGGLIVGYSFKDELTVEERAIFNIVSDHLASVVAGQFLFLENAKYTISEQRKKRKLLLIFLDNLSFLDPSEEFKESFDDLLHDRHSVVYDENIHKQLKDFLSENYQYFVYIIDKLQPGSSFNKRKNYLLVGGDIELYKASELFLKKISDSNTNISSLVNIPLLNKLFQLFEEDVESEQMSWEIENDDCVCLNCLIKNKTKEFSKSILKSRLETRGSGAMGFLAFLESYRNALLVNGNFYVKDGTKIVFDLQNHTQLNQNNRLEFTNEFLNSEDFSLLEFTVTFKIMDE